MASTVWRGHLTFGLVSIPVRLLRAARRERINLRQLHRRDQPDESEDSGQALGATRPPASDTDSRKHDDAAPIPSAPIIQLETTATAPVERVRQGSFTAEGQAPIPRNEIVKGYEFEPDRYVVVGQEDLEKIAPKTSTEMQIVEFVKLSEIDPIYLETSYYVSPEG